MAMFSYNEFDSLTVRDVSSSSGDPTIVYDGVDLPICGNITFVSIFVTNKSDSNKTINFSVRKMDDAQDTYLFYNVEVPPHQPYDILGGSKIFLKKEDILKSWTDVSGTGMLDLVVSYVIYTPSDLQPT